MTLPVMVDIEEKRKNKQQLHQCLEIFFHSTHLFFNSSLIEINNHTLAVKDISFDLERKEKGRKRKEDIKKCFEKLIVCVFW